jgi:hypothetical protein
MSGDRPQEVSTGPYRFEDPTWINLPLSISGRSRPGAPHESREYWEGLIRKRSSYRAANVASAIPTSR